MQIQFSSDNHVETARGFEEHVENVVKRAVGRFETQITRVEVHVSDENGNKGGANDKRCVMEARLAGRRPIAVVEQGDNFHEVIHGAAEKLKHSLVKIVDKLRARHRRA